MKTAIVVPTIRPDKIQEFLKAWDVLITRHGIKVYVVRDGEQPVVCKGDDCLTVEQVMGDYKDLIYNFNDGVRNLGFALAYKEGADTIISLDDDCVPAGDTIEDHLKALNMRVPITWMNTVMETYMRGFPYSVRNEAEVVLSHGFWSGVADFDAATQLTKGVHVVTPVKSVIPKGTLFPICMMNTAFKRKMTPFMYQAPMEGEINRFADIWGGIEAKRDIDNVGWAAVTGYATVWHDRASDPIINLKKEAKGIEMNDSYGSGAYFGMFYDKRARWKEFISKQ